MASWLATLGNIGILDIGCRRLLPFKCSGKALAVGFPPAAQDRKNF